MLRCCYVTGQGLGGAGWDINVHVPCVHTWMLRCCYVTGQGLGGVGWDINVHVPCVHTWMLRCCYVTGQGLGGAGWDINVHVPCVHTWMLRCCYVTGQGLGGAGWDINVHVPCVHTWMLRCCYVTGQGLGGVGGILTFMYLAYTRGCYAAATSLVRGWVGWDINVHVPCVHTWMLRCCYVTGQGLGGVSSSWRTRKDGAVKPELLQGIRIWQWRWHHGNSTDFLSLTGRALSKRLEK